MKIFLIITAFFCFNILDVKAGDDLDKINSYNQELNDCNIQLDNAIKKECPEVGVEEGKCSYTKYTNLRINLSKKQLECYNSVANSVFKSFYKENIEQKLASYNDYVNTSRKAFLDLYVYVDFCSSGNCGTKEYLTAYDELNFYIYQYINDHIKYIKHRLKSN